MKNKCKDCGREFKFPWKLVRHRNRKTPCSPIVIPNDENGILCPKCNRNFSSCSSRNRHLKICPARNAENLTDLLLENQKKLVKNQKKLEKKMIKLTEACVEKDDKIKEMKNREANRIMHNVEHVEHVYLIHQREFIKCKEPIYKPGRTSQSDLKRMEQYPKHSKPILYIPVTCAISAEKEIIKAFTENFIRRKDIGNEYFEGHLHHMIQLFVEICKKYDPDESEDSEISSCGSFDTDDLTDISDFESDDESGSL